MRPVAIVRSAVVRWGRSGEASGRIGAVVGRAVAVTAGPKNCPGLQAGINRLTANGEIATKHIFVFMVYLRYRGRTRLSPYGKVCVFIAAERPRDQHSCTRC